jgi:hypothetical protein
MSMPAIFDSQHFRGNMDNYDPAITDPLSTDREIVLFDNTGVGRTLRTEPRSWTSVSRADPSPHGPRHDRLARNC